MIYLHAKFGDDSRHTVAGDGKVYGFLLVCNSVYLSRLGLTG